MSTLAPSLWTAHGGRSLAVTLSFVCALVGGVAVAQADAGTHALHLEGGLAMPLTEPQASEFGLGGELALGYELRPMAWLGLEARVSALWLPSSTSAPTVDGYGGYYAPGVGVRLHPFAKLAVGDLWLAGTGTVVFTGEVVKPGLEVGLGFDFNLLWWLRVGPFVRYHHVFQTDAGGADAGVVTFGLSLAFFGIEPPRDDDEDGIFEPADGCPTRAEDVDHFEDADGCPDPDNDADGVLDASDRCATEQEDRDAFQDGDGCPDPDNDADGLLDAVDQCRDAAEDPDHFQDEDGCPDPDNDADGVLDATDRCPLEAETPNSFEDDDGCPDTAPRSEAEQHLDRLGQRINFPKNRAAVTPGSRAALRAVIALLHAHPEFISITVEAHASREGSPEQNMVLSQRRARTVIDALAHGGIARSRLVAHAFGDLQPEQFGDSEAEQAFNRRAVFVVERAPAP